MADELIDIFDETNTPLGIQKMKSIAHKEGLWHRCAHVWIYNSKGEIFMQLRAKNKAFFPGLWDIPVAGHLRAGEKPIDGAVREIKEEIGLDVNPQDLSLYMVKQAKMEIESMKNYEFYYVYICKTDFEIKDMTIQEEELDEIKFMPLELLEKDLKMNPNLYVPVGKYWMEMINVIISKSKWFYRLLIL